MVRIETLCARHIQIKLQCGESLRSLCQSLAAIVVGRSRGIFAGLAKVISCWARRTYRFPLHRARTQHFVQTLEGFSPVAIGIDADSVSKLPSQQTINGYTEPLAKHIPERGFDAADRVVDDPRHRTGARRCKLKFAEQTMNVARIFAKQQRL